MTWHNVHLIFSQKFYVTDRKKRHCELLLNFVKAVVDDFQAKNSLDSFHFFYEGKRFELRLDLKNNVSRGNVRKVAKKHLDKVANIVDIARSDVFDYTPEVADHQFGIDGWEIAKKIFECGSRLAIGFLDPKFRKGKLLRKGKLIHCMLNSLNYGPDEEKTFHIVSAVERQIVVLAQERGVKPENVQPEEAKHYVKDALDKLKIQISQ